MLVFHTYVSCYSVGTSRSLLSGDNGVDVDIDTGKITNAIKRAQKQNRINRKRQSESQAAIELMDSQKVKVQALMKEVQPN